MDTPSPASPLTTALDQIDGILVINLDTRPDRYATFMEQTGRHLPTGKLHRLSAIAGKELATFGAPPWFTEKTKERQYFWAGTAGCALSHRKAIEHAKTQQWKNVLILEDDAIPTPASPELITYALNHMKPRDMFYLGFNKPIPYGTPLHRTNHSTLWQVEGVLATHAYILTEGLYDLLLEQLPTEETVWEWISCYRAIDVFYRDFLPMQPQTRILALYPNVFEQGDTLSDIGGNHVCGKWSSCQRAPYSLQSPTGIWHRLLRPFHRLKIRLNSLRTRRRAKKSGLPGYSRKRKGKSGASQP